MIFPKDKRQIRKACTRADRLRQMSDSELRDFLYNLRQDFCFHGCAYYDECCHCPPGSGVPDCQDGIKVFLQEAVTDEQWNFVCKHFLEI